VLLLATLGAAAMLAAATVAYACTVQSNVDVDKKAGTPGSTVDGTGSSFASSTGTQAATNGGVNPVEVHFNSLDGAVVWSGMPDGTGKIAFSFQVPQNAAPGPVTIVATQTDRSGKPVNGTPARTAFEVLPGKAQSPATVVAPPSRTHSPSGAPQGQKKPGRAHARPEPAPARPQSGSARPQSGSARPQAGRARPPVAAGAPSATPSAAAATSGLPSPAGRSGRAQPRGGESSAGASAAEPGRQRAVTAMPAPAKSGSDGPTLLAMILLGTGLALTVVAAALVVTGRRSEKHAVAKAGRR